MRREMLSEWRCVLNAAGSSMERILRATRTPFDRLRDYPAVFRFRAGHWIRPEKIHEDEHGFFPVRPLDSGVDCGTGVFVGEPGRAGSDRNGRKRGEVRDFDFAFLLDWGGTGDAVRRGLHDAVLLRIAGAVGAGIPETPF